MLNEADELTVHNVISLLSCRPPGIPYFTTFNPVDALQIKSIL